MKKQDVYLGARQSNAWSPLWNAMFLPCQWSICLRSLQEKLKWMLLWSLAINTHAVQPLNSGVFYVKVPTAHLHTHTKGLVWLILAKTWSTLKFRQENEQLWTSTQAAVLIPFPGLCRWCVGNNLSAFSVNAHLRICKKLMVMWSSEQPKQITIKARVPRQKHTYWNKDIPQAFALNFYIPHLLVFSWHDNHRAIRSAHQ